MAGDVTEQLTLGVDALELVLVVAGDRLGQEEPVAGDDRPAGLIEVAHQRPTVAGVRVEVVGPEHLDVVEHDEQRAEADDQADPQAADPCVHDAARWRARRRDWSEMRSNSARRT